MKVTEKKYKLRELLEGFEYSELEGKGLHGLNGHLVIQPEFQRAFLYAEAKKEAAVVASVLRGLPLNPIYFNVLPDDMFEILDGQQRTTSLGRFVKGKFAIIDEHGMQQYFDGLAEEIQNQILDYEVLVYHCEGTEAEIKEWFKTINISGMPLNTQELRNAVFSGPFVTAGKAEFSNSLNSNIMKWSAYIKGSANRQDFWATALEWVAGGEDKVEAYMSKHRQDDNVEAVKTHFNKVLDWAEETFPDIEPEMSGLNWGELYDEYHENTYDADVVGKRVQELYEDETIGNKKGIFEFILGGEKDFKLLNIRFFSAAVKKQSYNAQTNAAKSSGKSNCSVCASVSNDNQSKIWKQDEMDADHVTPWSKGGLTSKSNCEMLCKTHNRAKGNR